MGWIQNAWDWMIKPPPPPSVMLRAMVKVVERRAALEG
jgi:hypothetical protein